MTQGTEWENGMGRLNVGGERQPAPATWPRDPRDRTQPRSRLNQALSVAAHGIDPPDPTRPDSAGSSPPSEQTPPSAFQSAFSDILGAHETSRPVSEAGAAARSGRAATADTQPSRPRRDPTELIDLREEEEPKADLATTGRTAPHYGLGEHWGRSWRDSAQGWVTTPSGEPIWRPVVATTGELANWDVDTYLGVVTAEVAIDLGTSDQRRMGATLARGREIGVDGLVEEAIERGAHGVIGVSMQYTPIGERLLLTMSGTAVTLREKGAATP